jgi:hypothetical protein
VLILLGSWLATNRRSTGPPAAAEPAAEPASR